MGTQQTLADDTGQRILIERIQIDQIGRIGGEANEFNALGGLLCQTRHGQGSGASQHFLNKHVGRFAVGLGVDAQIDSNRVCRDVKAVGVGLQRALKYDGVANLNGRLARRVGRAARARTAQARRRFCARQIHDESGAIARSLCRKRRDAAARRKALAGRGDRPVRLRAERVNPGRKRIQTRNTHRIAGRGMHGRVIGIGRKARIQPGLFNTIDGTSTLADRRMALAKASNGVAQPHACHPDSRRNRASLAVARIGWHATHLHFTAGVVDAAHPTLTGVERLLRNKNQAGDGTAIDHIAKDTNFIGGQGGIATRLQGGRTVRAHLEAQQAGRRGCYRCAIGRTQQISQRQTGLPDGRDRRRCQALARIEQISPGQGASRHLQHRIAGDDNLLAVQCDGATRESRVGRIANRARAVQRCFLNKPGNVKAGRHRSHWHGQRRAESRYSHNGMGRLSSRHRQHRASTKNEAGKSFYPLEQRESIQMHTLPRPSSRFPTCDTKLCVQRRVLMGSLGGVSPAVSSSTVCPL